MAVPEESGTRKLAAIMFTDVKGFSKKMGENEEAAMELLRTHDNIMKEVVKKYGGKVIKSIGDSFMVDFSSAVNAVRCSIEVQETFWNHNKGKEEFDRIEIRVGIHLGDVIMVGNDIFGDGVNIAARIEAITEPNRICISQDIYSQVKNKMQLNAYSIGSMELKNIAEPVEVLEVLLDSIPELSQPSQRALKAPSRKTAEAITKQEAQEAKKVEEAKQKAAEERRKAEEEKQKKLQSILEKAQEFLKAKELDKAEEQVKEVYKVVAIHPGAQMIQMQIDEERFRIQEEERRRRIEEENKKQQERAQKINENLRNALQCVEKDQLQEALAFVQKAFELEPDHAEAKQLQEQIQQREEAKAELERSKALAEHEREAAIAAEKEQEIKAKLQPPKPTRSELQRKRKKALLVPIAASVGGLLVVLVVLFLAVPDFQKIFASKGGSIAILPFETVQSAPGENYFGEVMASLYADHLGRLSDLTVIAPTTASTFQGGKATAVSVGRELGVRRIITGSVTESAGQVSVDVRIADAENGEILWGAKFEGGLTSPKVWSDVLHALAEELGVRDHATREFRLGTSNDRAFRTLLKALWLIQHDPSLSLHQPDSLIQQTIEYDGSFALAHATQAQLLLLRFKRGGELEKSLLRESIQSSQTALRIDPELPTAYTTLGEVFGYQQRIRDAKTNLEKSLSLQPNNAEAIRQLAFVALMEGDLDQSAHFAATALQLDPKNFETMLLQGFLQHLKNQYAAALGWYEKAIAQGGNDSLITTRYRFGAWSGEYLNDRVGNYCIPLLQKYPGDYRIYYWLGRAYQLSGRGLESLEYLNKGIALTQSLLEQDPENSDARSFAGFMLYLSGKVDQGIAEVEKAATENGSAEGMYRMARLYAIQNKKADALQWLKKATEAEFNLAQILNSDFVTIAREPRFLSAISKKSSASVQGGN